MSSIKETTRWLSQVQEEIIEPDQRIIDPHHHLWNKTTSLSENSRRREYSYLLEDLWLDTSSGHNVTDTIFIECSEGFWNHSNSNFNPVGETEFIRSLAEASKEKADKASISGIVGHANLLLGTEVQEVLEKHLQVGRDLFKGIRHAGGWDPHVEINNSHHNPPQDLYLMSDFKKGLNELSVRDLVFEAWQYHHQISQVIHIAKKCPDLKIVLNHFSGPIGIGPYVNQRVDIFDKWKSQLRELSFCENVFAKLGGMAMPINGFNFHKRAKPPSSDEFVEVQKDYYMTTIDFFGPSRCMFESNFPVDKSSISYQVLWNAFKKMVASFSQNEKDFLFFKTAKTVYNL